MTFPGTNRHFGSKGVQKHGCSEGQLQAFGTNGDPRVASRNHPEPAMRRLTERQRAQRFPIQAVLSYRRVGEAEWRQGMMVNISESGVLFETDHSAWPKTAVEMRFSLGLGLSATLAAQVVCYGFIVRAITEPVSARVKALAARITKFHFVRPRQSAVT
jgi:PilZ domain